MFTHVIEAFRLIRRCHPEQSCQAKFRQLRFFLYSARYPAAAKVWLAALMTNPLLAAMAVRHRHFPEKPFHHFASANMSPHCRAELVSQHFGAAEKRLGSSLVTQLYLAGESVELAAHGDYAFVMSEPTRCGREGLLTLAWVHKASNIELAHATVSFKAGQHAGTYDVLVGGLQGPPSQNAVAIRDATKACHGLRPKAVVMEGICSIARAMKLHKIEAVTNESHVLRAKNKEIFADYDSFWREIGGVPKGELYSLPLALPHRQLDEVPSSKRAAFRRRQVLLENLSQQIQSALIDWKLSRQQLPVC